MFLLIHSCLAIPIISWNLFTFQYVSINTKNAAFFRRRKDKFTFQYVSINTIIPVDNFWSQSYLHSNMFLLIQYPGYSVSTMYFVFTFQYVSINTARRPDQFLGIRNLHSNMFLLIRKFGYNVVADVCIYIPICFY